MRPAKFNLPRGKIVEALAGFLQNVYETRKQRLFQGGDLIKFNYCSGAE